MFVFLLTIKPKQSIKLYLIKVGLVKDEAGSKSNRLPDPSMGENGDGDDEVEDWAWTWARAEPEESGDGENTRQRWQRWS